MDRYSRKDMVLEMLKTEPNDVFLNYALGIELEANQLFEEAVKQFLKTLAIQTDYFACYYQLGRVAEKMKNEELALEYYKKGLELATLQKDKKAINEFNEAIWLLED